MSLVSRVQFYFLPSPTVTPLLTSSFVSSAFSENGSVTKEIFYEWYHEIVSVLFPDMQDIPGKRVLVKSDGGPGRTHPIYLSESHLDGLVHYPGLPNGTLFQELDQIFAYLKSLMEKNRMRIFNKLFQLDSDKTKVPMQDIGSILFGGEKTFSDGSKMFLQNAFEMAMDQEHLEGAQKKCGYVPANRIALESGKLRHEIVIDPSGNIDTDMNDLNMASLLLDIEKENHDVVDRLECKGYDLAHGLKRFLTRNDRQQQNQSSSCKTYPGTTEHQRRLSKASTQGAHFRATNGGAPMNCDDCLIAIELKHWDIEKEKLTKEKAAIIEKRKLFKAAKDAEKNEAAKPPDKWTAPTLRTLIRAKDASIKKSALETTKKGELLEMWIQKYSSMEDYAEDGDLVRWTKGNERLLVHMAAGKIENYEKTGVYKRAARGRIDFVGCKIDHIEKDHALALAMKTLQKYFTKEAALEHISSEFDKDFTAFLDDQIGPGDTPVDLSTLSDDDESYHSDADEQAASSSSNRRTRPRNETSDESSDESLLSEDADSISDHGCFFGEEEICYDDDHGNQHPSDSDQNYQEEYDCDDDGSTTNETPLTPDLAPTPLPPNVPPAARVGKCNLGSKYRSLINNYGPTFEGKRSSSNQDINSAGSHACWEVMDKDQLIAECKQRGLKADRRHATQTLIQNLQVWEKQN